jgi:hypothetical protein
MESIENYNFGAIFMKLLFHQYPFAIIYPLFVLIQYVINFSTSH